MKKIFNLLLILIVAIGFVACSSQKEVKELDKGRVVEKSDDNKPAREESDKEDSMVVEDQQITTPDKVDTNKGASTIYRNNAFKDVVVKETDDKVAVTGKAQVFEGVFQYKLLEGEAVLMEANYQTEGAPAWGDFTIIFRKDLINGNDAVFKLFVYSAKDGSEINILEIPIDK